MQESNTDPFHLTRFVDAQAKTYEGALRELLWGKKRSHWMWYIFPQIVGLGSSPMAQRFAIRSREEARAYLAHPILGARLEACATALLGVEGRTAAQIMGYPDDLKLRSSLTLFAHVSPAGSVFQHVLEKYYDGESDPKTRVLLSQEGD